MVLQADVHDSTAHSISIVRHFRKGGHDAFADVADRFPFDQPLFEGGVRPTM